MKVKVVFFSLFFLLVAGSVSAQNKNLPKSIISTTASIRQYYDQKELNGMQKGELLELYIERIKVLVKILPYVALATKPGITMADLGIPDDSEHRKSLDLQSESTSNFLATTVDFHRKMMPYSDKSNLIASILFYQNTLKELHVFNEL
jgi:hypothetical protein